MDENKKVFSIGGKINDFVKKASIPEVSDEDIDRDFWLLVKSVPETEQGLTAEILEILKKLRPVLFEKVIREALQRCQENK